MMGRGGSEGEEDHLVASGEKAESIQDLAITVLSDIDSVGYRMQDSLRECSLSFESDKESVARAQV